MHGPSNDFSERLFLQKDVSGDISVPCSELAQHQIDGVRFLFSQYKKEKPGVILNYPPGCGNSVQVAVYISAICEKLKRPVLILYDDEKEKERWLERFAKWTNINQDSIEVDTSNPYLRKMIFINNTADMVKFHRRYWGIIVVKSDEFRNILQKCQPKVDYKIWITSQDVKKDYHLLRSVITWIYPSDPLLQQYLNNKTPAVFQDDIPNDMFLDMLLEDILFTRSNMKPFGGQKRKLALEIQSPPVVSKKNKDATGKKIKRSKKPPEVSSTSTVQIENTASINPNENPLESLNFLSKPSNGDTPATKSTATSINEEESKMDVESFIRDNDPLLPDRSLTFDVRSMDDTPHFIRTSSPKTDEQSTESSLDFSTAAADIVQNENELSVSDKSEDFGLFKDNVQDVTPDLSQLEDVPANDETQAIDLAEPETEVKEILNVTDKEKNHLTIFRDMNVSAILKEPDDGVPLWNDQNKMSEVDMSKAQKIPDASYEEKLLVTKIDTENIDIDNKKTDLNKTEKESSDGNGAEVQESVVEVTKSVKKETESSFDAKMKELEEKALRKFKGSVLDNIF